MNQSQTQHQSQDALSHVMASQPGSAVAGSSQGPQSNLDVSSPMDTNRNGVHLLEQQQTDVVHPVDGNVNVNTMSRAAAHLNEKGWDLQMMQERLNLVGAFQWSLTDAVGTEIQITPSAGNPCDVPQGLLQNDIVSTPYLRFIFWRAKQLRVRFQLVASRFHQGRILVYFVPTMTPKAYLTNPDVHGPTRATQLQHVFLDPSNGTVADLLIPFRHYKGFLDLVFGDVLGQLHVQVLNQLQAATGASTSVEVKCFLSVEGAEFRVPRPGDEAFRIMAERLREEEEYNRFRAKKTNPRPLQRVQLQSGTFATIGGRAGNALDGIVDSVIPKEITGAIAGILLDKPAVTEFPEVLANKDAQYMSASRGVEKLERMTLEPSAQYLTTDQFGDTVDEMDINYLVRKPVYYGTFNWSATQEVGEVLFQEQVSPSHLMYPGTIPAPGTPFDPTILGVLGDIFTYWRGSICFIFQVVGTAFHEGRLDFCFHPQTITPPTSYTAAMSQYVNSQTIRNTNNQVSVRIPFLSDIPWKRTWQGESLADAVTDGSVRAADYVNGSFSVRVSVPLKNPNNVANNVDVNVFVYGGEDLQFHTLSPIGGRYRIPGLAAKVELQSGDLNTEVKTDAGVIALGVEDNYTYDPPVHHFGENYANLRECCKRYHTLFSRALGGATQLQTTTTCFDDQFRLETAGGLIGLMANSYALFRGPLNFKASMDVVSISGATQSDGRITGFITTVPQRTFGDTSALTTCNSMMGYSSTGSEDDFRLPPLVRFSPSQVAEFQIPFQSIYHSLLIPQQSTVFLDYFGNTYPNLEFLYGLGPAMTSTQFRAGIAVQMAFADETRLGVFLGFPRLTLKSAIPFPNPAFPAEALKSAASVPKK